jgi:Fic family protein
VLGKIFDKGAEKFVGGINTKKYMAIAKTSRATAVRDLNRLLEYWCLQQIEATAGRNIRYELKL